MRNAVSRKVDAEMHYCHTKSGYTIELFLPILIMAALCAGCASMPVDFGPGLVEFDARQYDKAMIVFQEIADKDSEKNNQARFYIGECYRYQSRYDRAIGQFQKVVDAEPPRSYLANQARDRISQINEGRRDVERLGVLFYSSKQVSENSSNFFRTGFQRKLESRPNDCLWEKLRMFSETCLNPEMQMQWII